MSSTPNSDQLPSTTGRWPRYLANPSTNLNREEPGAKAIYTAYRMLGPCRTKDAIAYALKLPKPVPEGTLKSWDARLKREEVVVLEGRTAYPEPPIAAVGRDLGFLREWRMDRRARRLAEGSAKVRYGKERSTFNNTRWHWEAYHAAPAITRAIRRKHPGAEVKVSRPRNPIPPRPILKEIYFEEYRRWRRELLGQDFEPTTS